MAVQKSQVSRSRRNKRRTHDKVSSSTLSIDPETGETHRRHHITSDGFYRGKQVIETPMEEDEE